MRQIECMQAQILVSSDEQAYIEQAKIFCASALICHISWAKVNAQLLT